MSRCGWYVLLPTLLVSVNLSAALAWDAFSHSMYRQLHDGVIGLPHQSGLYDSGGSSVPMVGAIFSSQSDYEVKLAYGRTFGTSTELDYATLEVSKPLAQHLAPIPWHPAVAEVHMALLASYVVYYEGKIERVKRLEFHDGYELAWLPKGKFMFSFGPLGVSSYLESGAGLSYVSETYRNSGSRWNWSLLGGVGLEKCVPGGGVSIGVQWRHLSNGNMWGKGDELHNSNSGTDMIQALATVLQRF
jgi:hypothetical protein